MFFKHDVELNPPKHELDYNQNFGVMTQFYITLLAIEILVNQMKGVRILKDHSVTG